MRVVAQILAVVAFAIFLIPFGLLCLVGRIADRIGQRRAQALQ